MLHTSDRILPPPVIYSSNERPCHTADLLTDCGRYVTSIRYLEDRYRDIETHNDINENVSAGMIHMGISGDRKEEVYTPKHNVTPNPVSQGEFGMIDTS